MSSVHVSPRLLVEQWPTALAMAGGGAWSLLPHAARDRVQGTDRTHTMRLSPGSDANLDAFAAWSGAPADRYRDTVPPISAARWAMPMVARLSAMAPHSLLKVLNQGVRLQTHRPVPRTPVDLAGRLVEVREVDGRVRVHTQVAVTPSGDVTPAMTIDTIATVVVGTRSGTRTAPPEPDRWERVGTWSAAPADGRRFFWLTGDFNPIHTSRTFARRTRFGGPILHGFGSLSRSHELLVDHLGPLADVDIRFVAPVPLPSPAVHVEVGDGIDGRASGDDAHVRAIGEDGTVHLAGSVRTVAEVGA